MRTRTIAVRAAMFMVGAPGAHAQGASTGDTQETGRLTQGGFRILTRLLGILGPEHG